MARIGAAALRAGLLAAALALPALAGTRTGAAEPPADLGRFKALEQAWLDAIARHDTATLDRLLAPGFVDTMWNGGLRDKPAVLQAARRSAPPHGHQTLRDIAVARYGDVAIVTGLDIAGDAQLRFTDIFVRHKGHWRAVRAQETLVRAPGR